MSTSAQPEKCERCGGEFGNAVYRLVSIVGGRCVQDRPGCFIHQLCESCTIEAKQWVSQKPPKPSTIHRYPAVNNRGGTL